MSPILATSTVGGGSLEIIILGVLALMLFGKNLPVVLRTAGKTLAQVKRALSDASAEVRSEMSTAADSMKDVKREVTHSLHVDMSDVEMPKIDLKTPDTSVISSTEKNETAPQDLDRPSPKDKQIATLAQPENTIRTPLIRPAIGTVRSNAISKAAALDRMDVPAPTKMPPSLDD